MHSAAVVISHKALGISILVLMGVNLAWHLYLIHRFGWRSQPKDYPQRLRWTGPVLWMGIFLLMTLRIVADA